MSHEFIETDLQTSVHDLGNLSIRREGEGMKLEAPRLPGPPPRRSLILLAFKGSALARLGTSPRLPLRRRLELASARVRKNSRVLPAPRPRFASLSRL